MNKPSKKKQWAITGCIFFIVALALLVVWFRTGNLTGVRYSVLKVVPMPLAFVNGSPVFLKDFTEVKDLADSSKTEQEVYAALIKSKQRTALAGLLNLKTKNGGNIAEKNFESQNALKVYYNSQKSLNPQAYGLAESLLLNIRRGDDFASLAKKYSTDSFSAFLGGETGLKPIGSLLPEIQKKVEFMQPGQADIVPSSLGLHIIQVKTRQDDSVELRQIFLTTSGFEAWLEAQLAKIKTTIIIKP